MADGPAPRIAVWGAWYGSTNVGDVAIGQVLVSLLRQQWPDARILIPTSLAAEVVAERYGVESLHQRRELFSVLRWLGRCDLVLVGGGTPIYDDPLHLGVMLLYTSRVKRGGGKAVLYGASCRPVRSFVGRALLKASLKRMHLVTVREPRSASLLRGVLPDCRIHIFADPVFLLEPDEDAADRVLREVGLRDSEWVALAPRTFRGERRFAAHHYDLPDAWSAQAEVGAWTEVVKALVREGLYVLHVPLNDQHQDDDRVLGRRIEDLLDAGYRRRFRRLNRALDPRTVAGVFGRARMVVGSRFHSMVLAVVAGTVPVAVAYGPKTVGLMSQLGMPIGIVSLAEHLEGALAERLSYLVRRSEELRRSVCDARQRLQRLARENFDCVVQLMG